MFFNSYEVHNNSVISNFIILDDELALKSDAPETIPYLMAIV